MDDNNLSINDTATTTTTTAANNVHVNVDSSCNVFNELYITT